MRNHGQALDRTELRFHLQPMLTVMLALYPDTLPKIHFYALLPCLRGERPVASAQIVHSDATLRAFFRGWFYQG